MSHLASVGASPGQCRGLTWPASCASLRVGACLTWPVYEACLTWPASWASLRVGGMSHLRVGGLTCAASCASLRVGGMSLALLSASSRLQTACSRCRSSTLTSRCSSAHISTARYIDTASPNCNTMAVT